MSNSRLRFRVEATATGTRARATTFHTAHNEVRTPIFMPVGTQATVKGQLTQSLEDAGSQILLANTYHLLLRPGPEVFRRTGGIHGFMSWKNSVLTDSGGFQIFSMRNERTMTEEGASFQSYLDGKRILLSPEVSIETQMAIGSDIMMALDQCIPSTAGEAEARAALEITQRWAGRSLAARGESPQALFAIVQGALFPELRRESADGLTEMPFDGFAIGGLAVGESRSERQDTCELTAAMLPHDRPRYLMGVGTPLDILEAVHRGVDMFDCIIPTQVAQRGAAFTSRGFLQLRRSVYKYSEAALDPLCTCPTCARYSRAYLHHLTKCGEHLGWQLLGQHNLYFYHQLMREIRQSIFEDRFMALYHEKRAFLHESDADHPIHKQKSRKKKMEFHLGNYEVHFAPQGFASIRQVSSGEIMHSRTPPMEEAQRLYIDQSDLATRLHLSPDENAVTATPMVIWDVGLGAAANAMSAILCYEALAATGPVRPMHIVSFENDLAPLKLAYLHNREFTYLRHNAIGGILGKGKWESPQYSGLSWTLMHGDFLASIPTSPAPPDLIFFDMFSSKTDADQWTLGAFRKIFAACEGRAVELFTYTCSTPVRASLLAAGFHVAKGLSTVDKLDTTVALTREAIRTPLRYELLSNDWFGRWTRSTAKFPADLPADQQPSFEKAILTHRQFQNV